MPRLDLRTRAFPITLAITVVLAFFPTRWLAKLQDISVVVNFPLMPIRHASGMVATWVRPPIQSANPDLDGTSVTQMYEEKEVWRLRYKAAEQEIRELQQQLEQLDLVEIENFAVAVRPITARITGRNPGAPERALEINRGSRDGVKADTIAVRDGVHLIGRVSKSTKLRSVMVPLTSKGIGYIRARLVSPERSDEPIFDQPLVQLEARGDGTLEAALDRAEPVKPGDRVLLSDSGWPQPAQALIIGTVESVTPRDEQPLQNLVIVRPEYDVHRLSEVTLVIEQNDVSALAESGEGSS